MNRNHKAERFIRANAMVFTELFNEDSLNTFAEMQTKIDDKAEELKRIKWEAMSAVRGMIRQIRKS